MKIAILIEKPSWGTPANKSYHDEEMSSMWLRRRRPSRYLWNRSITIGVMLMELNSNKDVKSTLLKALLKLSNDSTVNRPLPITWRISSVIFIRTVVILWPGQKPDWKGFIIEFLLRKTLSCLCTRCSKTLKRRGRSEIGQYSEKEEGFGFLGEGITWACFQKSENVLEDKEVCECAWLWEVQHQV